MSTQDQVSADEPTDLPDWARGTPEGRRIVRLLWESDSAASRGPKPRTSRTEVVQAGVALADAEGLAACSMRKVASSLGVGAMSLYTYVPGRSELIELMIDHVYAELERPDPQLPWRRRIELWGRENWAIYRRHPWLLDHNSARLPIAPNVLDAEESLYSALTDAGFVGSNLVSLANVIRFQLLGAARSAIGDQTEERRTGVSAEAYWNARASFWVTYFDPARYPNMSAIHAAGGFDDPDVEDFDRVLTQLLDGVERLAASLP